MIYRFNISATFVFKTVSMYFEWFVARRSFGRKNNSVGTSYRLMRIAIFGIALCIAVMIVSVAILVGFKKAIRDKMIGFGAHIQVVNYDANTSLETTPIEKQTSIIEAIKSINGVRHVQTFAIKAGLIKTDTDIQGIVLKGIDSEYDWTFFRNCLVEGNTFEVNDTSPTTSVVISQYLSKILNLKVNDEFLTYFIQDPPRVRKFVVKGIYRTDVDEIDKTFILCDIAHIQKLNNWNRNQISGYEIALGDFGQIDELKSEINEAISYETLSKNYVLKVESIKDKYPQVFDWLGLMDMNVVVILILMLAVSGFNMIAGLIILILDRTQMIGILKSMGASNKSIRNIFLIQSLRIIFIGLFYGNLIGIGLCLIQDHFKLIQLDPASYYVNYVPVFLHPGYILILNIGAAVVTFIMLLIPSRIISRLNPAETIKFA
ncbi:MAG TPA: FtsX-like permease family protein [Bacteroidales bacterium]|nr:FtsX-like permease family protein [Bacteroidales bacterium]HOK99502.1 FtsX-like permease family protein [Bacteroidales bacterium]HPO66250.1 FtsX-like permease family protein [Bacteroidales bacterium]